MANYKKQIFILFSLIFLSTIISAELIGFDNPNFPKLEFTESSTTTTIYQNGTLNPDDIQNYTSDACPSGYYAYSRLQNGTWLCRVDSGGGGSGTVTQVDTGDGLTGGPITTTGTISINQSWFDLIYVKIADLGSLIVDYVGNWSEDKPNYYNTTQTDDTYVNVDGDTMTGNLDMGLFNVSANYFNGKFNWTTSDDWNSFDGSTLSFNDSKLNLIIESYDYANNTKVDSLGNWSNDKSNYYNTTEVDEINTSMTNYVNTQDESYNTTMTNYVDTLNSSQADWVVENYYNKTAYSDSDVGPQIYTRTTTETASYKEVKTVNYV